MFYILPSVLSPFSTLKHLELCHIMGYYPYQLPSLLRTDMQFEQYLSNLPVKVTVQNNTESLMLDRPDWTNPFEPWIFPHLKKLGFQLGKHISSFPLNSLVLIEQYE
jgi:hypothetical protein